VAGLSPPHIGIFGGTFDPPHLGHLILACEAHYQLQLDTLLWTLTPSPPHKEDVAITPVGTRLHMVEAAIADNSAFTLSRVDLDRPPPHYALDTVRILRDRHPQATLTYLIGGDSLHDLPNWHRPRDFVGACDGLGVMRRPGDRVDLSGLEAEIPGASDKIRFIDAPLLEISSTQIRRRIARGQPCRYYLPPPVFQIIRDQTLYRESTPKPRP
jgi:nicotinate-nucleotide adenylyltransferase